ncbi:MAG: ABC transporter ATP-binding protein [bacterium]
MNIVDVQQLSKVYPGGVRKKGVVALDNVTLSVEQGEVFGLLGPNGAGKTTFLKVLLGITHANSGSATIGGLGSDDPLSRQKVGYLPENHRFPSHLTGLGLLEFTGRMYGMSHAQIDERTDELLELVGMDRWANTRIRKYSKGMSQRIGLAQSLICDPDILLLDEPTDGVDPVGKMEIRDVLKKVRSEGKSIVLNSHLLSEVEAVADRVAILSRGKLIKISSVEELTIRASQYEVEAEIGNHVIEIPAKVGKIITVSSKNLVVELVEEAAINYIIDQMRMKQIRIKSVQPRKVSLEQSFLETITATKETSP